MRVTLNLASHPFVDMGPATKRLRIAMGVLAVVALGLLWGLHLFHRRAEEARAKEHSLDAQVAAIARERQGFQDLMRQPANAQVLTHVAVLNRLFDEKSFSWTLAMEDLETVLPGGVQVSTLEPIRGKDGAITLHLRVIGPRDRAVELVQNLEHSRRFLFPRIVGENAEVNSGPGEQLQPVSASARVNFDLLAEYNTATSAEPRPTAKPDASTPDRASLEGEQSHSAPAQSAVRRPAQRPAAPAPAGGNSKPKAGTPR